MEREAASVEPTESKEALVTRLREEHHELDEAISRIEAQHSWSATDEAEIRRLKKLKLLKKDQITQLEQELG